MFVYSPNPDLRQDVFNVEPSTSDSNSDSGFAQIERSYREQMEQLEAALNCHPKYQHGIAFACGMRGEHLAFLTLEDFCEIKRDAIRHSYRILKEEHEARNDFQRSYQEMWKGVDFDKSISIEESAETEVRQEYNGVWKGFELPDVDDEVCNAVLTPEADGSDACRDERFGDGQVGEKFRSEENTTADRGNEAEDYAHADFNAEERCTNYGVIYGVHGDYSYDCEEDDEDSCLVNDDLGDKGHHHEEHGIDDSNHSSQLDYSYRSEDEDELDEQFDAYMQDESSTTPPSKVKLSRRTRTIRASPIQYRSTRRRTRGNSTSSFKTPSRAGGTSIAPPLLPLNPPFGVRTRWPTPTIRRRQAPRPIFPSR